MLLKLFPAACSAVSNWPKGSSIPLLSFCSMSLLPDLIPARAVMYGSICACCDEEGVTVLVTTHLMEEAEHCDRLAILNEGKLVALGSPFELKSQIGGDVITFETASEADAAELSQKIANRFIVLPTVLGNSVRLER